MHKIEWRSTYTNMRRDRYAKYDAYFSTLELRFSQPPYFTRPQSLYESAAILLWRSAGALNYDIDAHSLGRASEQAQTRGSRLVAPYLPDGISLWYVRSPIDTRPTYTALHRYSYRLARLVIHSSQPRRLFGRLSNLILLLHYPHPSNLHCHISQHM